MRCPDALIGARAPAPCDFQALTIRFFAVTAALCGVLAIWARLLPVEITLAEYRHLFLMPSELRPEPQERRLFLIFVVLLLPFTALAIATIRTSNSASSWKNRWAWAIAGLLFAMQVVPFIYSDVLGLLTPGMRIAASPAAWPAYSADFWLATSLCLTALPLLAMASRRQARRPLRLAGVVATALALATAAFATLLNIQNLSFVSAIDPIWRLHFDAAFYSLSQVVGGKTILADLPSQYGFFAELLAPFYRLSGLGVLGFSVGMTLLQVAATACLLTTAWRVVRDKRLFWLLSFAILVLTTRTWVYMSFAALDPYYQYWPIRFLFPAASVFLFWKSSQSPFTSSKACAAGVLSGLAMLWNLDSGVPVFGAVLAWLVVRAATSAPSQRRQWARFSALHVAAALIVMATFALYLELKSGWRADFRSALLYQDLFYRLGYFMLPMQVRPMPWVVLLGIYIFGVVHSLSFLARRPAHRHAELVFFVCILGIGLFTYYQGRSHELNILAVMWPAVLVAFFLADRGLRQVRAGLLPRAVVLAVAPVVAFGALSLWVLVYCSWLVGARLPNWYETLRGNAETPVVRNVAFIRDATPRGSSALILARNQAVYFAEAGLVSAVPGPGIVETTLVEDRDRTLRALATQRLPHVFLEGRAEVWFADPALAANYDLAGESGAGLLYLTPKASPPKN